MLIEVSKKYLSIIELSVNSTVMHNHSRLKTTTGPISLNATRDYNQKLNLIIKGIKR
jgi:hypothetical protein